MTTAKATWSVVVVYDRPETRDTAVCFCDQLVQRFWTDYEFDVSWFEVKDLQEEASAQQAGRRATQADLLIFALPASGAVSAELQTWLETWANRRRDREGALVGLLAPESEKAMEAAETHNYLRQVAHRAGMDYLTQVPQSISWQIPESLDSCTERASQVTSVLDEILRQQTPPPRLMS